MIDKIVHNNKNKINNILKELRRRRTGMVMNFWKIIRMRMTNS